MNKDNLALAIFAYNRVDHIVSTLERILKDSNRPDNVYIFVDGPKESEEDKFRVQSVVLKVKELIINFPSIKLIIRNKNVGLSNSVISGINYVFNNFNFDKIIVLEDDCRPDTDFFNYMYKSFEYYEKYNENKTSKVMHISGFGLPLNFYLKHKKNDVNFINKYPCSWGWGTWKTHWESCNFQDEEFYNAILGNEELIKGFNENGSAFTEFLKRQLNKEVDSWLIRWYAHLYKNNGLATWKVTSSIDNSGFDGSGNHRVKFDRFNQTSSYIEKSSGYRRNVFVNSVIEKKINKEFKKYFIDKKDKFKPQILLYFISKKIKGY